MCIIGGFCKGLYLIGLKNTVILSLCHLMTAKAGESAVLVINTMCSADREKAADIQYLPSLEEPANNQVNFKVSRTTHHPREVTNELMQVCDEARCHLAPSSPENLRNVGNTGGPVCPTNRDKTQATRTYPNTGFNTKHSS